MGRSYSRGVAIDKPHLGPDVAVRVAPVPQDDAARSRSSRAHVHVSAEVDAHLVFGVLVRRAASALARCYCVGVVRLSAALRRPRASFGCALWGSELSAPAMARQAASAPESLRSPFALVVQASRCVPGMQYGEFLGSVLPLLCRDYAWHEVKPGLRRLQRLSGVRFGKDQRAFEASENF